MKCFGSSACISLATKCIPYCKETAIGEYVAGAGEDLWFCESHYWEAFGELSPDQVVKRIGRGEDVQNWAALDAILGIVS